MNISLDTTDREQYKAITGMDELDRVLASIRLAAGKLPVKINCVVQRGVNEDAPVHLATLARDLPADVRFIELMPIGMAKNLQTVPNAEILRRIEERYGKTEEDPEPRGNRPAVYRRLEGFAGRIGFISAVHGKFCATCNRLRLISTGELKPCLCYGDVIPLREILRDGEGRKEERIREKIMEAVQSKPMAHCFEHREILQRTGRWSELADNREFTHFDPGGKAWMVDVSDKDDTRREATAEGVIRMSRACFDKAAADTLEKGDVLGAARIAGIMGASTV